MLPALQGATPRPITPFRALKAREMHHPGRGGNTHSPTTTWIIRIEVSLTGMLVREDFDNSTAAGKVWQVRARGSAEFPLCPQSLHQHQSPDTLRPMSRRLRPP